MKLSAEQYESVVASLRSFSDSSRTSEKRRSPRVGLRMTATLVVFGTGVDARRQEVKIRDLSAEGVGMTRTEPIPQGTYFVLMFRRGIGDWLSVLYRATHCERLSDRAFAVGARLDRVISLKEVAPAA